MADSSQGVHVIQMSDDHLDHVLAELAAIVKQFRAEYVAVDARAERLDDEAERRLEERAASRACSTTDTTVTLIPWETLFSLRCSLAKDNARQHREVFNGLVAWWADAAMIAVLFTAQGLPVNAVRVAAGDPSSWMAPEDLEHLPPIPKRDRDLAELSLAFAGGPAIGDPNFGDFVAKTQEHIESLGLTVRTGLDGAPTLVEDGFSEARRRRLWGRDWQEHRMPRLVETKELVAFLAQLGVPSETVNAISKASSAVEAARDNKIRIAELEAQLHDEELGKDAEEVIVAEIDQLLSAPDVTADRLIEYAQTLTASLPPIRVSRTEGFDQVKPPPTQR